LLHLVGDLFELSDNMPGQNTRLVQNMQEFPHKPWRKESILKSRWGVGS